MRRCYDPVRTVATRRFRPQFMLMKQSEIFRDNADNCLQLAVLRKPYHWLPSGDNLSGFGNRCGDDSLGVGLEFRIGELVSCEVE